MAKKEAKVLKLVCKCGECTHWEILLTRSSAGNYTENEHIKCMTCGTLIEVSFSVGPHEGLHFERQGKNEK
jgi:ribosomal protein S27E